VNHTLQTIHELHSTHGNFSDRPVGEEDLETIIDAAVCAATASARQSYSIVITGDPDLAGPAPVALVFCVDYNRLDDLARRIGSEFPFAGIVDFITGSTDTILAVQTAVIAARSLGIDSLLTNNVHRMDPEDVWRRLELPERLCFPLVVLQLGYATSHGKTRRGRLAGPGIVHRGTYRRATGAELDRMVTAYDDAERRLGLRDEFAEDHYLRWFFESWSGAAPQRQKALRERLEKSGFLRPVAGGDG
jgi:nitroreductase